MDQRTNRLIKKFIRTTFYQRNRKPELSAWLNTTRHNSENVNFPLSMLEVWPHRAEVTEH